jgi:hypothetical protein
LIVVDKEIAIRAREDSDKTREEEEKGEGERKARPLQRDHLVWL